jgi:hypothetical protein
MTLGLPIWVYPLILVTLVSVLRLRPEGSAKRAVRIPVRVEPRAPAPRFANRCANDREQRYTHT